MHRVNLTIRNTDKEILAENGLEASYVQNLLQATLNLTRPIKRVQKHNIRLMFVDSEFSYYTFSNVLNITKHCFKSSTKNKRWFNFFEDLLHEMCHYMQFKVDRVSITEFFVEHETSSHTKYMNNSTERQARRYGNIAHEAAALYGKLLKARVNDSKQLSKLDEKGKDQTS